MIKIKSIQFPQEHPVLGNLELNFCDNNGTPADTIIIAGENGTGKTTILEEIYKIMKYECDCKDLQLEVLCGSENKVIIYNGELEVYSVRADGIRVERIRSVNCNNMRMNQVRIDFGENGQTNNSIYSTVNINFSPNNKIKSIQANGLDNEDKRNYEFNEKTATDIKQLLVDITNDDNRIKAEDYDRVSKGEQKEINKALSLKTDRFINAFNFMFDNIKYKGIDNRRENIEILFKKNGKEISIDDLSSGEKQIVFRGAFLLQDKEALNGAVVLIDEPEISMHPKWQKKILDYYRELFIDNISEKQTSQIIVSTHSNFVIENALKLDNCVIIALPENNQVKKIIKGDGTFILPAVTAEEINYHVFNITSIGYHIQLFGYLHSLMEKHFSKDMNIKEVDDKIKNNKILLPYYYVVDADSNLNPCRWIHNFVDNKGNPKTTTYDTICCFIRNAIDHPDNLSSQSKKEYIEDLQYSIEILIELINLAKSSTSSLK